MTNVNNQNKPRLTHLDERKVLQVPFYKYEERVEICKQCFAYEEESCKVTGNPTVILCKQKSASCPLAYWSSYYGS